MGFNISLSGIGASQKDLNTTSNNIANSNTYGFKESRAEFGDVYSSSIFSNAKTTTGGGVQTSVVAQQFHEGSSIYTNNPLDMRISGSGFFAVADDSLQPQNNSLSRNGAFHLNKDNYMVNSENQYLLGYKVDSETDQVTSYEPQALKVPDQFGQPRASTNVQVGVNLPANADAKDASLFNHNDPATYDKSTSVTIYDSLGQPYKMSTYYTKDNTAPNRWVSHYTVTDSDGEKPLNVTNGGSTSATGHKGTVLDFNSDGSVKTINGGNPIVTDSFAAAGIQMNGGDDQQTLTFNYDEPTQYAAPFEVRRFNEDGATTGYLAKVDIDPKGSIVATYSNGENVTLGRVGMVRVPNEQGLVSKGGTQWVASQDSGAAIWGEATQGAFGAIKSGTLEQSNIDMTQELVDLITAQRNFQANSRALEVDNQLQQTILQIR
ncbi:flagellar hook protein FlgE [Photobacterium sanguinicancri]|uniref:Flagellar hook protein FlgE n=1 Tax=Photobacterium sanguinicancri TaxID=875932 RepID=A0AAW7YA65_9GAMM|nr:flagellar hook protein FlgE [Photobacterium sanguinicancri]KXI24130.1 flagellar biosynthesis protein FlgE [Photobacterium sanguinicancri]MDO6500063.1 flagellar hook protein FlgE [Photobacterium sanguinicancri]MDO6543550.1 flagellar hook protein FlgE [Photobacterium sanguinicancri]OZS45643.1 flagellar hook protein FlgE [Photobacterium sanguinicancri]